MRPACWRGAGVALLLGLVPGAEAAAQAVAGHLTDAAAAPVAEAIVTLVDSTGREVARTSTSSSGRFRLAARAAGRYQVRVFRIGHRPWSSDALRLAPGETHALGESLPAMPIELPELVAVAPGACETGAASGSAAAILLEEARKALGLAREANRRGASFAVTTFDITLDRDLRVIAEREAQRASNRDLPIVSTSVDTLRQFGFVRQVPAYDPNGPMYYGPDDAVLLSDWFLTSHCFAVAETGDSSIAVRFEPAARRGLPDIEGTMQFDRDSLVLRSLQFTYVRLPSWVPAGSSGGAVEFERIPGTGLVATQWWLRAPIAAVPPGRGETRLHGFREAGGIVLGVQQAGDTVPLAASDSLLRRSRLPAAGTSRGAPGGDTEGPIMLQQEIPGAAGRRVLARNDGPRRLAIVSVQVRECVNVASGCGRYRLDREIPPGATAHLLIIRPRDAGRAYSFEVSYDWEERP